MAVVKILWSQKIVSKIDATRSDLFSFTTVSISREIQRNGCWSNGLEVQPESNSIHTESKRIRDKKRRLLQSETLESVRSYFGMMDGLVLTKGKVRPSIDG